MEKGDGERRRTDREREIEEERIELTNRSITEKKAFEGM